MYGQPFFDGFSGLINLYETGKNPAMKSVRDRRPRTNLDWKSLAEAFFSEFRRCPEGIMAPAVSKTRHCNLVSPALFNEHFSQREPEILFQSFDGLPTMQVITERPGQL
jgi:hypothetical protein